MPSGRPRVGLIALATACFISVTAENSPIALLPDLTRELSASAAQIGLLVTGYAGVVAVTAIPLVRLTARFDRRTLAMVTIAAIALTNLLAVFAPNFELLAAARVFAAAGHGIFWSIVAPMAARLVPSGKEGQATATVFAGNSIAILGGIPLTSALGNLLGWRITVAILAIVAGACAMLVARTLPPLPADDGDGTAPERNEQRRRGGEATVGTSLRSRALLAVIVATFLLVFGHFAAYTYVTVLITHFTHLVGTGVSIVLLVQGIAGLMALLVVRRRIDGSPRVTSTAVAATMAVALAVLVGIGTHLEPAAIVMLVVWAAMAGTLAVILQAAVLRAVPRSAQDTASAVYVVAFQIGIAGGAAAGGQFIGAGAITALVLGAAICFGLGAVVTMTGRAFGAAPAEVQRAVR